MKRSVWLMLALILSGCMSIIKPDHWRRCVDHCKDFGGLKEAGAYDFGPFEHMCCECTDESIVELFGSQGD